ncbi:MAG: glycosyltransferase family 2 protein [Candidatus Nealsonbacteria bacterium]|nr:glycosyltransferase family 2 protein [Candidatus Nealsonbacteria bacterium]
MYLSVIIPAYNEEKRLPKTLEDIGAYLSRQNYSSEIIVVDACSSDKTPDIARKFSVKLLEVKNCQGKGQAIREGMSAARGSIRLFTDADNSTSIDQIEKMLPYFGQGYDVVIGSRDIKGAVLNPPQPFLRKMILGKGFRLLRKFIVGLWSIQDTQCGFKCFSQKSASDIFPKITIMGFSFDAEALILAKKFGYKIKEVPVVWVNDLNSKVKPSHMVKMLLELIKVKLNLITGIYG